MSRCTQRTVKLEIDTETLNYQLDTTAISKKLKVVQGYIFDKTETATLLLFRYGVKFGLEAALTVYNQIDNHSKHIKINAQTIPVLNKLLNYCVSLHSRKY